jgi:hypothetical protein
VPAAWPVTIEARVVDDCGEPLINGSVTASFSNNDPPLALHLAAERPLDRNLAAP